MLSRLVLNPCSLPSGFNLLTTRKTGAASTLLSFLHDVSQHASHTYKVPGLVCATLSLTGARLSRINQGETYPCTDTMLEGHQKPQDTLAGAGMKESNGGHVLSMLLCFPSVKMNMLHFCKWETS